MSLFLTEPYYFSKIISIYCIDAESDIPVVVFRKSEVYDRMPNDDNLKLQQLSSFLGFDELISINLDIDSPILIIRKVFAELLMDKFDLFDFDLINQLISIYNNRKDLHKYIRCIFCILGLKWNETEQSRVDEHTMSIISLFNSFCHSVRSFQIFSNLFFGFLSKNKVSKEIYISLIKIHNSKLSSNMLVTKEQFNYIRRAIVLDSENMFFNYVFRLLLSEKINCYLDEDIISLCFSILIKSITSDKCITEFNISSLNEGLDIQPDIITSSFKDPILLNWAITDLQSVSISYDGFDILKDNNYIMSSLSYFVNKMVEKKDVNGFIKSALLILNSSLINDYFFDALILWTKEFFEKFIDPFYKGMIESGLLAYILKIFTDYKLLPVSSQLCSVYFPYILSKTGSKFGFFQQLFLEFHQSLISLKPSHYLRLSLIHCIKIDTICSFKHFMELEYDKLLSRSLIILQTNAFNTIDTLLKNKIEESRIEQFEFIGNLFSFINYRSFLLSSNHFIESICSLFIESQLWPYSFSIVSLSFQYLTFKEQSIIIILRYIRSIFSNQSLQRLSFTFLKYIASMIRVMPQKSIRIFYDNDFIETIIKYVSLLNDDDSINTLIDIIQIYSSIYSRNENHFYNINQFNKIQMIFNENRIQQFVDNALLRIFSDQKVCDGSTLSLVLSILEYNTKKYDEILAKLIEIVQKDNESIQELSRCGLSSYFIQRLSFYRNLKETNSSFDKICYLLPIVGEQKINSKELTSIISNLRPLPGNFRPLFSVSLIKAMVLLFKERVSMPSSYFKCDGKNGLPLQEIKLSEPLNEFSIVSDIRIFGKGEILYLSSDDWSHLALEVSDDKVICEIVVNNQTFKMETTKGLISNTWFRLFITLYNNNLSIFMNDEFIGNIKIPKIQFFGFLRKSVFSRKIMSDVSSLSFLNRALSIKLIHEYKYIPIGAIVTFSPSEAGNFPKQCNNIFSQAIHNSSLLIIHAASMIDDQMVNISPNYPNGQFIAAHCLSFNFSPNPRVILPQIGGISVLLPLFAQLDQPILPKDDESVMYSIDEEFLPSLIRIIHVLLENSQVSQENFYYSRGFTILSYLLSKAKTSHFSDSVIHQLFELFSILEFLPLAAQMIHSILFNFKLWIFLSFDIQKLVFSSIITIFDNFSDPKKQWFVSIMPFSRLICLMRVCLWSQFNDEKISLLSKPKLDPVTKIVESERDFETINKVRSLLWILAVHISSYSFNLSDANTLCYLSFDISDIDLAISNLSFLIRMIKLGNNSILHSLRNNFRFSSFYPLMISNNQRIRGQCIHLFMALLSLSESDRDTILYPHTIPEWVNGLIFTTCMDDTTTLFADLVFGYVYSLYDEQKPSVMPSVRVSKSDNLESFRIAIPQLLPFAIMIAAYMDDASAEKYMLSIDRAIAKDISILFSVPFWDHPFILFLLHRNYESSIAMDNSSKICLHTLTFLYSFEIQNKSFSAFGRLPFFIELFSLQNGNDYSFITRDILVFFLEKILLDQSQSGRISNEMAIEVFRLIFRYIFAIPIDSLFYLPFESSKQNHNSFISFQDLHRKKMCTDMPDIKYSYATRTSTDGIWVDALLAEEFLQALSHYMVSYRHVSGRLSPHFIYSFTIGIGLSHINHFSVFIKYLRDLTNLIPSIKPSDVQISVFCSYMTGLIKVYLQTDQSHPSHLYLQEDTQSFSDLIFTVFKQRMNWGSSIFSFDSCFEASGYNYAHMIMEKYLESENIVKSQIDKLDLIAQGDLDRLVKFNASISATIAKLSSTSSTLSLNRITQQLNFQMLRYASEVKYSFDSGYKPYVSLWRSLTSPNGPWCNDDGFITRRFKLSKQHFRNHTRGRFKQNFAFNDHKDASLLRDVGNVTDANEAFQEHLKQLKLIEFSGDQSVISLDPEDTEESQQSVLVSTNSIHFKVDTKYVSLRKTRVGTLILTSESIIFEENGIDGKNIQIEISSIKYVFLRQYLLLDTAIEIYTTNQKSFFFDFVINQRYIFLKELKSKHMTKLKFFQESKEDVFVLIEKASNKWRKGLLSNFDYLMKINIYAGRTYNDLSQYPVFPWVISDYKSSSLDFEDHALFRDLSKPIGAINETRLEPLIERMRSSDSDETRFLYGSFYSSAAVVIGYLIRIEPFTSLHIELQSGRFDITERLFNSIPRAWESVQTTSMDFRELLPEFYYMPDFLTNTNGFDLGPGQCNVELPPWASSPYDFITKNRAALESQYVSVYLPRWIDLVFGYASRGQGAIDMNNVFSPMFFDSYLTDSVKSDQKQLHFAQEYAACFGQAPMQLFFEPHKGKVNPFSFSFGIQETPLYDFGTPIICICSHQDILTFFGADKKVFFAYLTNWQVKSTNSICYSQGFFNHDPLKYSNLFSACGNKIIIGSPWDSSFSLLNINGGVPYLSITKRVHLKAITCVMIGQNYALIGSADFSITFWKLINDNFSPLIPLFTLSKHKSPITSLSMDESNDMVVSTAFNGTIVLSSLIQASDICVISFPGEIPVSCSVLKSGTIIVAFSMKSQTKIRIFDQNLHQINEFVSLNKVDKIVGFVNLSGVEFCALMCHSNGIQICRLTDFYTISEYSLISHPISIEYLSKDFSFIIGTQEGTVYRIPFRN